MRRKTTHQETQKNYLSTQGKEENLGVRKTRVEKITVEAKLKGGKEN